MSMSKRPGSQWRDMTTDHTRVQNFHVSNQCRKQTVVCSTATKWANGMPGGPKNPLGARALYLYANGEDTLYRIHGTNEPLSIGKAMSSGCIRMLNEDVADLFERVNKGTHVVVLPAGGSL